MQGMRKLIQRQALLESVTVGLRRNPVVALIGPRQCGKTTLARTLSDQSQAEFFDLENPRNAARLEHPLHALEDLRGLVVIDEIQRRPDLFPILRVLADRDPIPARFLILGSASPDLIRGSSESLAGRVTFVNMGGFDLSEVGPSAQKDLWWRGGFPRSFLAEDDDASRDWLEAFIQTFLERDLRALGIQVPAPTLRRFWSMLAHYHGQIWNASELGRSLQMAHTTVKHHLDLLCGALVVRQLPPWFENLRKRQVKSPKIYIRDSGLLHALLQIPSRTALDSHPKLGASWEGFALEQVLRRTGDRHAYFWATPSGAELDLLLMLDNQRIGVEFKFGDAPTVTKSMQIALHDLRLDRLLVVYPGPESGRLHDRIEMVALADLDQALSSLPLPRHGS